MQLIYLQVIYDSIKYTLKYLNPQEGVETYHRHENNTNNWMRILDSVESATIMLIINM